MLRERQISSTMAQHNPDPLLLPGRPPLTSPPVSPGTTAPSPGVAFLSALTLAAPPVRAGIKPKLAKLQPFAILLCSRLIVQEESDCSFVCVCQAHHQSRSDFHRPIDSLLPDNGRIGLITYNGEVSFFSVLLILLQRTTAAPRLILTL